MEIEVNRLQVGQVSGYRSEDATSDFGLLGHNEYRMIYVFYLTVYKCHVIT